MVRDTKQMPHPAAWDQHFFGLLPAHRGPKGPIRPWQLHPENLHRMGGLWVNEKAAEERSS